VSHWEDFLPPRKVMRGWRLREGRIRELSRPERLETRSRQLPASVFGKNSEAVDEADALPPAQREMEFHLRWLAMKQGTTRFALDGRC
jgi:hypothetical protein